MPPSWKTLEVVSFGTLGKLYSNFADTSIKKTVARSFNVPNHEVLDSWIAALAALRNCCAHHARTWNRKYPMKPQLPPTKKNESRLGGCDGGWLEPIVCVAVLLAVLGEQNTTRQYAKDRHPATNEEAPECWPIGDGVSCWVGKRDTLEIKKPKGRGRETPPSSVEKVSLLLCAIFSRECEDIGITITGFRPDSFLIRKK